jgi:polyisoprenoid-binding protein YceI
VTQTECDPAVTRIADGAELPAPGRWQIDPGHTELAFIGRHFMLTKVRGRFTGLSGVIEVAEAPGDSTVAVTVDMTTVASGNDARDEHLRSADFFDVAHHLTAAGTIDREDWGLTWNLPLDGGGLVVSNQIRIEIELEAVLQR